MGFSGFISKIFDKVSECGGKNHSQFSQLNTVSQELQLMIRLQYKKLHQEGMPQPKLDDVGFRVFSQNDEDGRLLFIFSQIGSTNKKCIEICAGDGIECNTANLIINHGWHGLLVDGDENLVQKGIQFYSTCKDTRIFPPQFVHAWIEPDNVNELIQQNGFLGEIDLLSIDIDGMDYWIWDAITIVNPRVVVLEYQDILGPDRSVTAPYSKQFSRFDIHPDFFGASLRAFYNLGKKKGYSLIGTNRYQYNAFFVRNDVGKEIFPEITVETCFTHPKVIDGMKTRLPPVKDMNWMDV
jgi:hypothetical protein